MMAVENPDAITITTSHTNKPKAELDSEVKNPEDSGNRISRYINGIGGLRKIKNITGFPRMI